MKKTLLFFALILGLLIPAWSGTSAPQNPDLVQKNQTLTKAGSKKLERFKKKLSKRLKKIRDKAERNNGELAKNALIFSLAGLGLLLLGIVIPYISILGIIGGLVGGIMGLVAYQREKQKASPSRKVLNQALGGIWVGLLSSLLTVVAIVLVVIFFALIFG